VALQKPRPGEPWQGPDAIANAAFVDAAEWVRAQQAAGGPRGTFSAEAAERFGAASDPIDRIAKATEESAEANKQAAKNTRETAENTTFTFAWGV